MSSVFKHTELTEIRKLFPVTEKFIYLDHSGVSPVSLRTVEAIDKFLEMASSNGVISYQEFMDEVEKVRSRFAGLINSEPEEIAFIKNTSHGISIIANGIKWNNGDNVVIVDKEFPTNIYPWLNLAKRGVEIRQIPLINGRVREEDIFNSTDSKTRLLSISSVQFTSGYRADLKTIGDLSAERGFIFCVDAIQSLGVIPLDVKEYKIDFLAADGHKWLLSPEGTGILYCNKEICSEIEPVLVGWKSVINDSNYETIDLNFKNNALKFEEGSFNVMGIIALGSSLDFILEIGVERIFERIQFLGDIIIEHAKRRNFKVKTPIAKSERGGIITFECRIDPLLMKEELLKRNIVVNVRSNAIRVSPHLYNTEQEIEILFNNMEEIIESFGRM